MENSFGRPWILIRNVFWEVHRALQTCFLDIHPWKSIELQAFFYTYVEVHKAPKRVVWKSVIHEGP